MEKDSDLPPNEHVDQAFVGAGATGPMTCPLTVADEPASSWDARRVCPSYGRRFNPASYEKHQRVCQKVLQSTRPQFDPRYPIGSDGGSSSNTDSSARLAF